MIHHAARYRLSSPNIVHEAFEDEIVVVSLDSGLYFHLEGTAATCWQLALAGRSLDQMVDSMLVTFEADRDHVESTLSTFFADLVSEGLIVPDDDLDSTEAATSQSVVPDGSTQLSFLAPVVGKYKDLRHLLLIDPVHMVNNDGWPELRVEDDAERA